MMQGAVLSICTKTISQKTMHQRVRPVSGPASDKSSSPKVSHCPGTPPSTMDQSSQKIGWSTAVDIAGGSRRVAVRYAPLMLQGSARSWLNSLPSNSINCRKDFDDAFV